VALLIALASFGCRGADMGVATPVQRGSLASTAQPATSSRVTPPAARRAANVPLELGLIWPNFPSGVPPDESEVALGKELFSERLLSADDSVSCETCHDSARGFADPRPASLGIHGKKGRRNSPTLLNAAYYENLGWGGQEPSIEAQSLAALTNPEEMGLEREQIPAKLGPRYGDRLRAIYGEATPESIVRALAAFQRMLVAGDSPFDRYIYGGDQDAVSEQAKRGFAVFIGEARCIQCHFMRSAQSHPFGGFSGTFTDNRFHNIGIGYENKQHTQDLGREEVTHNPADRGAFKTPTLRNVALTAPYMHDGSLATLMEVVEHYNKGGVPNPNLDFDVKPLHLTDRNKADLVAFLQTLTSVKLAAVASNPAAPESVSGAAP